MSVFEDGRDADGGDLPGRIVACMDCGNVRDPEHSRECPVCRLTARIEAMDADISDVMADVEELGGAVHE